MWYAPRIELGINIALVALPVLRNILIERQGSEQLITWVENASQSMLGGVVRRSVTGGGRSYLPSQVVFLDGHQDGAADRVEVGMWIDGEVVTIGSFKLAHGDKPGSALYFATWMKPK